jgi:hypothetical protein
MLVTYLTKYKRLRATIPRPALQGLRGTFRSNKVLAIEYSILHRVNGNAGSDAQNLIRLVCAAAHLYPAAQGVVVGLKEWSDLTQV